MYHYTYQNLNMNVSGDKFVLPLDIAEADDIAIQKVVEMFTKPGTYNRAFMNNVEKDVKIYGKGNIRLKFLFEGYDEHYPFYLELVVFRFKYGDVTDMYGHKLPSKKFYYKDIVTAGDSESKLDDKLVNDGQLMVAMRVETEHGGLLEELVDVNTIPSIIEKTKIKKVSFISFI